MTTPARRWSPGNIKTFRALAHPSFRLAWSGGTLWFLSIMMEMAVLSWLVLELTNSPGAVAVLGFFRTLPMFLFGMVSGSVADRFSKKLLMVITQGMSLTGAVAMLILLVLGVVEPWHAYVVVFITGVADVTDFSARRSYYAEILDQPSFLNAVSLHAASAMGSGMVGPALGGLLISFAGYEGAYGFMVVTYILASVLISRARASAPSARPPGAPRGPLSQVREAFVMMKRNRTVRAALLVTVTLNFCAFPYMAMVAVIARDILRVTEIPYGFLAASIGFGAFVGALVIASRTVRNHGNVYFFGSAMLMACVFLFGLSSFYPFSLLALVAAGLGQAGFASMQAAMVLLAVGPEMRGRAMGAVALAIGASPFGSLAVGQLAELLGPQRALMALSAVGFAILMFLRWWFPELRGKKPEATASPVAKAQAG